MNEIISEFLIIVIILTIAISIWLFSPPKNWWCNRSEMHEFGGWEDFVGPEKDYYYQCRVCHKCKYKDIKSKYIGWGS